jgi:hypothetical protein
MRTIVWMSGRVWRTKVMCGTLVAALMSLNTTCTLWGSRCNTCGVFTISGLDEIPFNCRYQPCPLFPQSNLRRNTVSISGLLSFQQTAHQCHTGTQSTSTVAN